MSESVGEFINRPPDETVRCERCGTEIGRYSTQRLMQHPLCMKCDGIVESLKAQAAWPQRSV